MIGSCPFRARGADSVRVAVAVAMAERAAHLVDRVFPDASVRQWVLSLAYRLRYRWPGTTTLSSGGRGLRAGRACVSPPARPTGRRDRRAQRRGRHHPALWWCLNLNVHVHALVIDGVFAKEGETLRFRPAGRLTRDDVAAVVAMVRGGSSASCSGVVWRRRRAARRMRSPRRRRCSPAWRPRRCRGWSRWGPEPAHGSIGTVTHPTTSNP
jgi:hypothetical protein